VGLWSRLAGMARDDLTRLLERRAIVQATLMRGTIHIVSRRDFWPFALATAEARRRSWLAGPRRVDAAEMEAAARLVEARLSSGPVQRRELDELVGKDRALGVGHWVHMVRVPPSGTWKRRRADLFAAAETWLGPPWRYADDRIELAPFGRLDRATRAALREEADRVAAFHA
jgi:winged helix DNA-binding protein